MRFPLSKLGPVRTTKRNVVKARPQLIERLCTRWGDMLVNAEQRAAKQPHDVVERAGVLVEHRIGPEQSLIPGPAPIKISDCHGDMRNRGKLSHHVPNSSGTYSTKQAPPPRGDSRRGSDPRRFRLRAAALGHTDDEAAETSRRHVHLDRRPIAVQDAEIVAITVPAGAQPSVPGKADPRHPPPRRPSHGLGSGATRDDGDVPVQTPRSSRPG